MLNKHGKKPKKMTVAGKNLGKRHKKAKRAVSESSSTGSENSSSEKIICDICDKEFPFKQNLDDHVEEEHQLATHGNREKWQMKGSTEISSFAGKVSVRTEQLETSLADLCSSNF